MASKILATASLLAAPLVQAVKCYEPDNSGQATCLANSPEPCVWNMNDPSDPSQGGYCADAQCYKLQSQSECKPEAGNYPDGCMWNSFDPADPSNGQCNDVSCDSLQTEGDCDASVLNAPNGCLWYDNRCQQASCYLMNNNQQDCEANKLGCKFEAEYNQVCQSEDQCNYDEAACKANPTSCAWSTNYGCQVADSVCWTHGHDEAACNAEQSVPCSREKSCQPDDIGSGGGPGSGSECYDERDRQTCDDSPKDPITGLGCSSSLNYCNFNQAGAQYYYTKCLSFGQDSAGCNSFSDLCDFDPNSGCFVIPEAVSYDMCSDVQDLVECDRLELCISMTSCRPEEPPRCSDSRDSTSCAANSAATNFGLGCEWVTLPDPQSQEPVDVCKAKAPVICYSQPDEQTCQAANPAAKPCVALDDTYDSDENSRIGSQMLKQYNCREPVVVFPGGHGSTTVSIGGYSISPDNLAEKGRGELEVSGCRWIQGGPGLYGEVIQPGCEPVMAQGCMAASGAGKAACDAAVDFDGTANCGYIPKCYNETEFTWPYDSADGDDDDPSKSCRNIQSAGDCQAVKGCSWGECIGHRALGEEWPCRSHDDDAQACANEEGCFYLELDVSIVNEFKGVNQPMSLRNRQCGSCSADGNMAEFRSVGPFAGQTCSIEFTRNPTLPPTTPSPTPTYGLSGDNGYNRETSFTKSIAVSIGTFTANSKCDMQSTKNPTAAPTFMPTNQGDISGDTEVSGTGGVFLLTVIQPGNCEESNPTRKPTLPPSTASPTRVGDTNAPTAPAPAPIGSGDDSAISAAQAHKTGIATLFVTAVVAASTAVFV